MRRDCAPSAYGLDFVLDIRCPSVSRGLSYARRVSSKWKSRYCSEAMTNELLGPLDIEDSACHPRTLRFHIFLISPPQHISLEGIGGSRPVDAKLPSNAQPSHLESFPPRAHTVASHHGARSFASRCLSRSHTGNCLSCWSAPLVH